MGLESRNSFASSSRSSAAESDGGPTLGATIEQWQVNAIIDSLTDDEGGGDVDAALRRLEGQISHGETKTKRTKVDGWVRQIRERLAAGDYGEEPSRFPTSDNDSEEEDYGEARRSVASAESMILNGRDDGQSPNASFVPLEIPPGGTELEIPAELGGDAVTPVADKTHLVKSPLMKKVGEKPVVEEAIPPEILHSRLSVSEQPPATPAMHLIGSSSSNIGSPAVHLPIPPTPSGVRRAHKSWIMDFSAQTLAEHFAMIDRELFTAIKFEEIIAQDALTSPEEANVLDWAQFLGERARAKAARQFGLKTSSLVAVRARFNLVAKFVISEILLTHPSARGHVFSKFVRIAYVSVIVLGTYLVPNLVFSFTESAGYEQLQHTGRHHGRTPKRIHQEVYETVLGTGVGARSAHIQGL